MLIEIINKPLLLQLVGYLYYWQMGFNSVSKGLINLAIRFLVIMDVIVTAVNNEPSQRFYVHAVSLKSIFRHVYRGAAESVYSPRRVYLCTAHRKGRVAMDGLA